MPRQIAFAAITAITITLMTAAAVRASDQSLPTLKVSREKGAVHVRPALLSDVVAKPVEGTVLEAIDLEDGWYWVILPPDEHGTRLPGWIRERDVQIVGAGEADSVLHHFSEAVAESKARMEAEAAEQAARLEQARQRLEDARHEYDAVATKKPGPPAA